MNERMTLKRPKPGDNEDELFSMQEEFLQTRQEPSAKVINLRAQGKSNEAGSNLANSGGSKPAGRIRSKFAERKSREKEKLSSTSQSAGSVLNPEVEKNFIENKVEERLDAVQNIPINPSKLILGTIVEKKYKNPKDLLNSATCTKTDKGFPNVFLVDQKVSKNSGSLFLQQISQEEKLEKSKIVQPTTSMATHEENSDVKESQLQQEIHEANIKKLREMSTEEILEAKKQLECTMNPQLLEFLKNKRKNTAQNSKPSKILDDEAMVTDHPEKSVNKNNIEESSLQKNMESTEMQVESEPTNEESLPVKLAETAASSGWLHMDTIEKEKFEWMKDVPAKNESTSPEEPYNARFDFNGVLLPFNDEKVPVDKGLHHHGDEPERPGYALQELIQLSRSSNQQQRCMALTTLANIMEKSRKGWYDRVLEPAPLTALSEKNIFLLLRFSLDDTSIAVVTATLQALREFFYSEADEVCLDRLVGWNYKDAQIIEPELSAPKTDVTDTSNLKDYELAQLDTVAAALRSDIVLRIRYILSEMYPPPVGVTAALEILTRLARHSRTTALNIACTPHLLETIVQHFIPLSVDQSNDKERAMNAYGIPSVVAVRFCRILVLYAGRPVAERLKNLRIIHSIISYTTDESKPIGIRLSIESLRLWKLLISHNVGLDGIAGVKLALLTQLQLLLSNHDLASSSELMCEQAAALIDISIHEPSLRTLISTLLTKWSTQLTKISSPTWGQTKLIAVTLGVLNDVSALNWSWIGNSNLFENLCSRSNLLCTRGISSFVRDPSSLPSLGVLMDDGELQPLVSLNSMIPFLATSINALCENSRITDLRQLLNNDNFVKYINRLSNEDWNLERSWYTRCELYLVTGIIRLSACFGNNVDKETQRIVLKIAVKLISALPGDAPVAVKEILNYVLNDDRALIEKLSNSLETLKLNETEGANRSSSSPMNFCEIYTEYLSSSGSWETAAMPKDWLYLPLVSAYTILKNQHDQWNEANTMRIIVQLSLELYIPEIVQGLSPSLRFSRLLLVYLCDTVYLNNDVSILLDEAMPRFLKKYHKKLDLTSELPGLSSFTDLFTSLCESFCANSYGNEGFSMALLVPLAQRHDVHYRKLLWSEHAGALRYIRLKPEKLVIPITEFLYPVEEDSSLIESYMTALVRGTVKRIWCPLMYEIALHHSAMYSLRKGKLPELMRKRFSNLSDQELSRSLLNYEPPGT